MKILLTGASGLVGSRFARAAKRRGHSVVGVVSSWGDSVPGTDTLVRLDLGDPDAVTSLVLDLFPDAVVNAAAISEPAACEAAPDLSHAVNMLLPERLAQAAHHLSARMVHLSSEQVFDGRRAPYHPNDPVAPVNLYGRQKVASEASVLKFAPVGGVTVRAPLLTGNSLTGKRSLHERLFAAWAAGQRPRLFSDEVRQPCTAENLAEVMLELCERADLVGVFHWAGAEPLSRYEMGRQIAKRFGIPQDLIESVKRVDDPASAWRQPDLSLRCGELAGKLKTRQESFGEQLEKLDVPRPFRSWYHSL
jgi:dTDP-4-dehydrorhamnose reductase